MKNGDEGNCKRSNCHVRPVCGGGLRPYLMELRSTRKPWPSKVTDGPLSPGELERRCAERALSAMKYQPPPRVARLWPNAAPVGSVTEPLG
jgi:hypothetical protein